MNNLSQAIWVETLKFRRSKMPLLTLLGFLLVPLMGGFFMIILKDPRVGSARGTDQRPKPGSWPGRPIGLRS